MIICTIVGRRYTVRALNRFLTIPADHIWQADGTLLYLHGDHLGSTILVTKADGTIYSDQGYRAYGRYRHGGTLPTDHRFTGQKLDNTGLYYYNARYYDPEIGQFISPDTLVPDPTNVFAYNRYMYVAGNPMRLTDSSGHVWETIADVISVGYDIYDIANNGLTWESGASLAVDVVGAVVPFVPSAGACVRWCDEAVQYGDEALEYGGKAVNYVGDKLDEGWQATKEAFGMGDETAEAVKAADNIPCAVNSFSADTLVMTPTGAKPIAELAEGELALAYNEATGHIGAYPITDVISHVDPEIVLLTLDGDPSTSSGTETLETTAEHPFYELEAAPWLAAGQTEGHWTDALDLKAGDHIWQADGTTGVVQAVKVVPVQQRMYNLTVAEAHTFFVGDGQWLVHNACDFSYRAGATVEITGKKGNYTIGFDASGNPDFSPHAIAEVQIDMKGNYTSDFTQANKAAGFNKTPTGYTWHHHQDGKTMQLVPTDLHKRVFHYGGVNVVKNK